MMSELKVKCGLGAAVALLAFESICGVLPEGYVPIQYVQGTGTAYVDLGTKLSNEDTVVADVELPAAAGNAFVYGSRTDSSSKDAFLWGIDASSTLMYFQDSVIYRPKVSYSEVGGHRIVSTNGVSVHCLVDLSSGGRVYESTAWTSQAFETPYDVRLFWASGTVWAKEDQCFTGKVYSFKVIRDGVARMELVPCKNAEGVVGFCDVSPNAAKPFYASEAGAFEPGPDTLTLVVDPVADQFFTSEAVVPELSVFCVSELGSEELENGVDYDVVCSNNVNVGVATAIVRGVGFYEGLERQVSFRIVPPPDDPRIRLGGNFARRYVAVGRSVPLQGLVLQDADGQALDPSTYALTVVGGGTETGAATVMAEVVSGELAGARAFAKLDVAVMPLEGGVRLEYVQGTGTAYVDLGTKLSNEDTVVADVELPAAAGNAFVYGSRTDSLSMDAFLWGIDASSTLMYFQDSVTFRPKVSYSEVGGHRIVSTNGVSVHCLVDLSSGGRVYESTAWTSQVFETPYDVRLFWASGTVWAREDQCFAGKVYSFKVIRDGVVRMELVPCKDAEGVVGFCDVSPNAAKPFYASEAGAFEPGPDTLTLVVDPVADQFFTSEAVVPELSVFCVSELGSEELENGVDYDVVCSNNVNVGVATAIVRGVGFYEGLERQVSFRIVPPPDDPRIRLGGNFARRYVAVGRSVPLQGLVLQDADGQALDPSTYALTVVGGGTETGAATVMAEVVSGELAGARAFAKLDVAVMPLEGGVRLEYVQGTGTAYVDLGTKLSNEDTVVADVELPAAAGNAFVYGSRKDSSSKDAFLWGIDASSTLMYFCDSVTYRPKVSYSEVGGHRIVSTNGVSVHCLVDLSSGGRVYESTDLTSQIFETPYDVRLFWASGTVWAREDQCFAGKVYSFKVIRDGVVRMELVPCKNAEGVVGFCDVSPNAAKPFYASEAGAFEPGGEMPEFEVGLVEDQLDYGTACKPSVMVTDRYSGLPLDPANYTVSYSDNVGVGTATVTVVGKEGTDYEGCVVRQFRILPVYRVTGTAAEAGSGMSWTDPMTYSRALVEFAKTGGEIWISGTVELAAAPDACTFPSVHCAIRGGFAGTEERADERRTDAYATLDGGDSVSILSFSNAGKVEFDRICFLRGANFGVNKLESEGDLVLKDCRFERCGSRSSGGYSSGGGCWKLGSYGEGAATLRGSGLAQLWISNCLFFANCTKTQDLGGGGTGAFISGFARATIEDTDFMENRCNISGEAQAAALQLYNQPATIRCCQFRGNVNAAWSGKIVGVFDASGGTVFTNCLFVGNRLNSDIASRLGDSQDANRCPGPVVAVRLDSADATCHLENCTFAYNYTHKEAALGVGVGRVTVRNSIFHRNVRSTENFMGVDAWIGSEDAHLAFDWTMFNGGGDDHFGAWADNPLPDVAENCLVGLDPNFVTKTAAFDKLIGTTSTSATAFSETTLSAVKDANVHLRGKYVDEKTHKACWYGGGSPAVNAGDPKSDCAQEPPPNGRRVNLGAYGNTPWATMSPGGLVLFVQ